MKSSERTVISGVLLVEVLLAVISVQYYLVNKPAAVDVISQKIAPARAKLNQEELLIEDAIDDSAGILFLMNGQLDELIDIRFDKARLEENTLEQLAERPTPPPPSGLEVIDFIWEDVKSEIERQPPETRKALEALISRLKTTKGSENSACRTLIKAEVVSGSKFPTKQHFYQTNADGLIRDFYLTVDTDLLVSITVSPRIEKKIPYAPFAPGCGKLLKVGHSWKASNPGYWDISVIAPANSKIHFTLIQDKNDSLWKEPRDLFEPFEFGSNPLRAKSVTVQSVSANAISQNSPPRLNVTAIKGQLLAINRFSLNNEAIQLDFSGTAWAKANGETVTINVLESLMKYPLYAAAQTALVGALITWFVKSVWDMFKREPVDDFVKPDDD